MKEKSRSFGGAGFRLGATEEPSQPILGQPVLKTAEKVCRRLCLYVPVKICRSICREVMSKLTVVG